MNRTATVRSDEEEAQDHRLASGRIEEGSPRAPSDEARPAGAVTAGEFADDLLEFIRDRYSERHLDIEVAQLGSKPNKGVLVYFCFRANSRHWTLWPVRQRWARSGHSAFHGLRLSVGA